MRISALLTQAEAAIGQSVLLKGWVRTVRKQKSFSFVEVNDGSCMRSVQVVAPGDSARLALDPHDPPARTTAP